ncbi:BTB/POZ domain-containing protein [Ditylenchus destructor]|nr:BTB/POZ domain-containing protein [Ditylenchus destructor]
MDGRGFVNYLDAPHYVETGLGIYHNLHCSKFPCTETGPCTEIHPRGPCQSLIAERDYYHIHTIIAEDYFLPNARRWLGPCRWTHMPRGIQCDVYLPDSQRELLAEGLIIDKEGRVGQLPRKVCGENGSLTAENHSQILGYAPNSPAAVLRIVEKKDSVRDDFEKNSAADVKFLVNGSPIFGDRKYLSAVSPVFDKMLNGGFVEAKESEIELKDIEPVIFDDFLLAVWRKPAKPNPVNVVPLLELADRFDVSILRDSCERHLMLCYEIPLIHRLILSQKYSLNDLNSRTLSKITTNLAQQLLSTDDEPKYKKPRRSDSETSLGQIWAIMAIKVGGMPESGALPRSFSEAREVGVLPPTPSLDGGKGGSWDHPGLGREQRPALRGGPGSGQSLHMARHMDEIGHRLIPTG